MQCKTFDVNVFFKSNKKKEREEEVMDKIIQKLPSSNDEFYVEYNLEENSYQVKTDRTQDGKDLPANIRLDEDVLIKTNIVALLIRLQKTSSRHLQDILTNTNIFVLTIRLQDVFKTSSRRLAKTSSRHLQDVFKTF